MGRKVHIEVFDRLTGERNVAEYELPIEIGKQPTTTEAITLDPKYQTISRIHGLIEERGQDIVYTDCSSNGTTIAGLVIKGAPHRLERSDIIGIENYNLRLVELVPIVVKHTGPALEDISHIHLVPGQSMLLTRNEGSLNLMIGEDAGDGEIVARGKSDSTGIAFEVLDEQLLATFSVNKALVHSAKANTKLFDVVSIGGDRFELLTHGHEKIICGNPDCNLLNDLPFEENCIWCGYYLAAAGGFTRVTPS
jgi:FHA domain